MRRRSIEVDLLFDPLPHALEGGLCDGFFSVADDVAVDLAARLKEGLKLLIKRKINLYGATPHVFRHTYITLAASSGMDVKTLQSIAGHSDIKMTLDRYAHKRETNIIAAGGLISSVFRSM